MSRLPYLGVFSSEGLQGQICHSDRQTYKRADYGLRITDGWTGGQDRGVNGVFLTARDSFFYVAWTDWTGGLAL